MAFDLRRDLDGWTVFDRWTGEPVVMNQARQTGLSWAEAAELVEILEARRDGEAGDRRILQ